MAGRQRTNSVDLVATIDTTRSMTPIIGDVKKSTLSLHDDLQKNMAGIGKNIDVLQGSPSAPSMRTRPWTPAVTSDFFALPEQRGGFSDFLAGIRATGGSDELETGPEALAATFRSPWAKEEAKQQQPTVLWTDASTHQLARDKDAKSTDVPGNMDNMTGPGTGQISPVHRTWKRMLMFSSDAHPQRASPTTGSRPCITPARSARDLGQRLQEHPRCHCPVRS
jgi:hypothetical protein